jgi:hypothetical protein
MDRGFFIVCLVLTSLALGCARSGTQPAAASAPAEHLQQYLELPGLASSPHAGLKAELALLSAERMTPHAIDAQIAALQPHADYEASSGRTALNESIPAISRPLLKAQLDEVYRGGPLRLSPIERERARELLRRWADDRARFRQALQACAGGLGLRSSDGVLADLQFLEVLQLGCRLESLAAAEALDENQPESALDPLEAELRAARILAREWNVSARVAAVHLREDALHVLAAIANHDQATSETHEHAVEVLERETLDWPSDAAAWIGDRAAGLVTYELIRDGYYLSLLDGSELERLRENRLVEATATAVMRNIDDDELFYLSAMRRVIASCEQPYYERRAALDAIQRELADRERSGDYPLVAALLLSDFATGHREQAEDRARCLAWQTALRVATSGSDPSANREVSPVTGQRLTVSAHSRQVIVRDPRATNDQQVMINLRPTAQQTHRFKLTPPR